MTTEWKARKTITTEEERVLRLCKKQKLWAFLRRHQQVILDEEMRAELASMYPTEGPGRPPVAPEILALAMLLQVGFGVADHEVPTLTAVDMRWQMVLGCMGGTEPLFSQGTVFNFRERARDQGLMRRLLEKTAGIARSTGGFDHKRMRAIIDSSPLLGAGRVEDTFNLLGRAINELIDVAAAEAGADAADLARELDVSVALGSSVKAVLDVDWRDPTARARALQNLLSQFDRIRAWLDDQFDAEALAEPPLSDCIATVERIIAQDTEPTPPDPDGSTAAEANDISEGVSKERLISLSDRDMRHGRKSKSKVFAGYKRHVSADADVPGVIAAVEVLAANRHEQDAAKPLLDRLGERFEIVQVQIDRGYLHAPCIVALHERGVEVISKAPHAPQGERFGKAQFEIDFVAETVTCPGGTTVPLPSSGFVRYPKAACQPCPLRDKCLTPANTRGKQIPLHPQERWYREMSAELATSEGRQKRRERTMVEHTLARVGAIQGARARYRGREKNQAHLEAVAAVNNCYVIGGLIDRVAA